MQSGSLDQLNDFKGLVDFGTFFRTDEGGIDAPNCPLLISAPATPMIAVLPENMLISFQFTIEQKLNQGLRSECQLFLKFT